jgi:ribosomal-protein-alanine N-acetyltransferase
VSARRARTAGPTLPIVTRRLLLRDFVAADRPAFAAFATDTRLLSQLLYATRAGSELERQFARMLAHQQSQPRRAWELAVVTRRGGRLIGSCDLALSGRREADLGYMLARRHWGYGYATELARALVAVAFATLPVERVLAVVEVDNERSRRVLENAGLRWEALLRRHARAKGRWWDCHLYAISRVDWAPAAR